MKRTLLLSTAALAAALMVAMDGSIATARVTPQAGVKAAFDLLCQNSAQFVVGGSVNKHTLKATAQADVVTLSQQLNVSPFVAATYLATAAQQIYMDKTAIDSCPGG